MRIGHSVELVADGSPRLMLVYRRRLTPRAIENLRASWERAWAGPEQGVIAIDEDPEIFQLVDGRWQPLAAPDGGHDGPTAA